MALTAPIPTINGSQTEFSKVWIRGSTATATLPNIKLYSADGRAHHPYTGTLDVTIVHTAADTLYNRIQAAATAADATLTAARFDRWFKKAKITGFSCDAITGDTLLVNRSETTGLVDTNLGDDGRLPAKAAATFYAQETYAVGRPFMHGNIPAELVGLTGATVNVSGEVETSQAWKTGTPVTGIVDSLGVGVATATDLSVTGNCAGMASIHIQASAITGAGPSVRVDCYVNGAWEQVPIYVYAVGSATNSTSTSSVLSSVANSRVVARVPAGATLFRVVHTATTGPHTIKATPSAHPYNPTTTLVAGVSLVSGSNAHNAAVASNLMQIGVEARTGDGTAVSNGGASRLLATVHGKLVTNPYALPAQNWQYAGPAGGITDLLDDQVAAAAGANTRNYVTAIQIVNMSTTATEVVLKDDATIIWRMELDADGGASGISVNFPTPLKGSANKAINVACLTTAAKVYVNAQGFFATSAE